MRALRVLGFAMMLVLASIGALWLSLPWLVSTETVQAAIERELTSFAGTPARLVGETRVRLFPRPVALLNDVELSAYDSGDMPLLRAEKIQAEIALGSLLRARPRFSAFYLERAHLTLRQSEAGTIDWQRTAGRIGRTLARLDAEQAANTAQDTQLTGAGTEESEPAALPPTPVPNDQKRFGIFHISNGKISIIAPSGDSLEELSEIDARITWPQFDTPLSVDGSGIWRGASIKATFSTRNPVAFFLNRPSVTAFTVQSEIASGQFSGDANLGSSLFADGAIEFSTPSMRALGEFLRTDIATGGALGAITLSGPIRMSQSRARFEALDLTIDGNSGNGVLEIALGNEERRPTITGTLDFEAVDIAALVSAFINIPRVPGETGDRSTLDSQPVPKSFGLQPDADLRLSAATARFGGLELANLAATTRVSDEVAIFDIGDAAAYGGHVQARLQLSVGDVPGRAEMILSGQDVDTTQLGETVTLPPAVPRGRTDFTVTLNAPIDRWDRIARTARGTMSMKMRSGYMPGFSLQGLADLESTNRYYSLDTQGGESFAQAMIAGDIEDGLITLTEADITYPRGLLSLEGIVSYASGSLALTASLTPETSDTEAAAAPSRFFVGGSWARPFATPVLLPEPAPQ